jgi:hypothetical protein
MSFTEFTGALARILATNPRVDVLAANELEFLADRSLELARRYERAADFMDDEEGQQVALALSAWRRDRSRYFRELSAEAERTEAKEAGAARAELEAHAAR